MLGAVRGVRGISALAAAFCVAAVVAGCGGSSTSAGPTALPTSASVSQTSTATVDPASDEAILAAARNYVAAAEAAARTGDTEAFRRVATQDCNCWTGVRRVADFLQEAHQTQDLHYAFLDGPRIVVRTADAADVAFQIDSGEYDVKDEGGKTVAAGRRDGGSFVISLQRKGDGWLVFLVRNG